MALGGMFAKPLPDDERADSKLPNGAMALKVQHVGQYAPHDRAKQAGVRMGDILVSYNGRSNLVRETDLLAYALNRVEPDATVPAVFLRDGEKVNIMLPTSR